MFSCILNSICPDVELRFWFCWVHSDCALPKHIYICLACTAFEILPLPPSGGGLFVASTIRIWQHDVHEELLRSLLYWLNLLCSASFALPLNHHVQGWQRDEMFRCSIPTPLSFPSIAKIVPCTGISSLLLQPFQWCFSFSVSFSSPCPLPIHTDIVVKMRSCCFVVATKRHKYLSSRWGHRESRSWWIVTQWGRLLKNYY